VPAYYNEIDPFAAQWLRNLIAADRIAPGDVDERSIEEVNATDLVGYGQCHFFAGIGVWSCALRSAGWSDEAPVWTGSCPCQPFSDAGRKHGIKDERHLWPEFFRLIAERRPGVVFGEQVASRDALAWLDVVQADLEGAGYAVGAVDTCAAGYGAPHIRQRLYWVADADAKRWNGEHSLLRQDARRDFSEAAWGGEAGGVGNADSDGAGRGRRGRARQEASGSVDRQVDRCVGDRAGASSEARRMANADGIGTGNASEEVQARQSEPGGAVNGYWADAEWIYCLDGKHRPTKPGVAPLAARSPGDVGKLRAYGNAIVAPQATEFVRAFIEVMP